jgi:hypothetical protein
MSRFVRLVAYAGSSTVNLGVINHALVHIIYLTRYVKPNSIACVLTGAAQTHCRQGAAPGDSRQVWSRPIADPRHGPVSVRVDGAVACYDVLTLVCLVLFSPFHVCMFVCPCSSPVYSPFHRLVSLRALAAHYAVDEPGKLVLQWLGDGSVVMVDGGATVSQARLSTFAANVVSQLETKMSALSFGAKLPNLLHRLSQEENRNDRHVGFTPFKDLSATVLTTLHRSNQRGVWHISCRLC